MLALVRVTWHLIYFLPIVCAICFFPYPVKGGETRQNSLEILNQTGRLSLEDQTVVMFDPGGMLTFDEVTDPKISARFQKGSLRAQFGRGIYWFRITFPNESLVDAEMRLATGLRRVIEMDLYTPTEGAEYNIQAVRVNHSISERPIPDSYIAFPIHDLPKRRPLDIYLRIKASPSSEGLNPALFKTASFQEAVLARDYPSYFYNGMAFALGTFNLLLFFFIRDSVYIYYVFQVLFSALWVDTSRFGTGFLFRYVWPNYGAFDSMSPLLCIGGFLIFFFLFAAKFVDLKAKSPRLYWLTWALIGVCWSIIVSPIFGIGTVLSVTSSFLLVLTSLSISLGLLSFKSYRPAKLFLAAFFPYLILMFVYFGDVNFNFDLNWPIPPNVLGSSLEMLLMSLVLADRFNQVRKEKDDAQAEVIETLRRSEQKLESMVEQRTKSLRETQSRLVQSEKMAALGTLVAGVAHEINTPLGVAITANSQVLLERDRLEEAFESKSLGRNLLSSFLNQSKQGLSMVAANLSRAADLVGNFKQVAVDQNTQEARQIDLGTYVGDVVRSLDFMANSKGIKVINEIPDGIGLTLAPGALAQILTSLIQNAGLHAFEGTNEPIVTISAKIESDSVKLLVADNGNGMSEEVQAKAFDPFFTTKRGEGGGTGLGLHIVHNLVTEALHGTIALRSAPGQGTEFTITLIRSRPVA
jgi:signal transduction histidine kinase